MACLWRCAEPRTHQDFVKRESRINCLMFAHAHRVELARCFMEVDKREIMADFVSKCQNASTCELWDRMGKVCEALRDALLEISIATGRRSRNAGCMMIHYWHGVGCIRAMCSPQHEGSVSRRLLAPQLQWLGKHPQPCRHGAARIQGCLALKRFHRMCGRGQAWVLAGECMVSAEWARRSSVLVAQGASTRSSGTASSTGLLQKPTGPRSAGTGHMTHPPSLQSSRVCP